MAKQLKDDEASLKRRARRRLIGAVVLTTVVVVLLPMLLDSEPKLVGQDIELRIPPKDKAGEFVPKVGLLPASAPVAAPSSSTPVNAPATADTSVSGSQAKETKAVPAQKKPDEPVKTGKTAPEHKPEPKISRQVETEPQQGFVVQVGAFTKTESAHYLQKKLSKEGFKVYTEKVADKTRVRTGPYATREVAEKVRHKLEAEGLHPAVTSVE